MVSGMKWIICYLSTVDFKLFVKYSCCKQECIFSTRLTVHSAIITLLKNVNQTNLLGHLDTLNYNSLKED